MTPLFSILSFFLKQQTFIWCYICSIWTHKLLLLSDAGTLTLIMKLFEETKTPEAPFPVTGQGRAVTPPYPQWKPAQGTPTCLLKEDWVWSAISKVHGQLCLHRDQDCRGNCNYSFLVPTGPWAQSFLCSHTDGAVYKERKHTLIKVQARAQCLVVVYSLKSVLEMEMIFPALPLLNKFCLILT